MFQFTNLFMSRIELVYEMVEARGRYEATASEEEKERDEPVSNSLFSFCYNRFHDTPYTPTPYSGRASQSGWTDDVEIQWHIQLANYVYYLVVARVGARR